MAFRRRENRTMSANRGKPEIRVEVAHQKDAEAIAAVLHAAFAEFEPIYTPEAFAATTPAVAQIHSRWHEGPVWIAIANNNIVGTVAAVVKQDSLYVFSMAVLPAAQGQGIGRLLLEAAENYARTQGCNRLFLSTTPFLTDAIRLYERFGFERTDEGPDELFGTPLFTMEKRLPHLE